MSVYSAARQRTCLGSRGSQVQILLHRPLCGSSSVGRASAFQAECREFDPRLPLHFFYKFVMKYMVAVVQLVERQFVVLVVAGSSPVGHPIHFTIYEPLAQSVEHMTFNHGVTGSIPVWLTIQIIMVTRMWRNWQTHQTQDLAPSCVWVRVPPSAPNSELCQDR